MYVCIWFGGLFYSLQARKPGLLIHNVTAVFLKNLVKLLNLQKLKCYFKWGLDPMCLNGRPKKKKQRSRDCKEVKTFMIHEKKFCGFAKQLLLHANERLRVGTYYIVSVAKVLDGRAVREGRANGEFSKKNLQLSYLSQPKGCKTCTHLLIMYLYVPPNRNQVFSVSCP